MNAQPPLRRGACPRLTVPMPTGDGLLARLAAPGITIGLDTMAALGAAARRHGNGIIEVTARGSIQVRGLSDASAPAFAETVAALGIDPGDSIPILVDPLAGLEPEPMGDALGLAGRLRERLADAPLSAALSPKVSVAIDSGRGLRLDAIRADIRLRPDGTHWGIALGGDAATATPFGPVAGAAAAEAAVRLITVIAQHGPQARARELVASHGAGLFRAAIADLLIDAAAGREALAAGAEIVGTHRLRDGLWALGVGLAFGHTDADALDQLIDAARRANAGGLRTAPGRALLLIGLSSDAARGLADDTQRLGFITRCDDPRRSVVACAGAPVCASAKIAARSLAPLISIAAADLLDGSLTLHLSGCRKGCAHPEQAALTLVGDDAGCGIVVDGCARDPAQAGIAIDGVPAGLQGVAAAVARARQAPETSAQALRRLGSARVAALLRGDRGGDHG